MKDKTTINPVLAKLPFKKFVEWHDKFMSSDKMMAEERYLSIGGKLEKPTAEKPKK